MLLGSTRVIGCRCCVIESHGAHGVLQLRKENRRTLDDVFFPANLAQRGSEGGHDAVRQPENKPAFRCICRPV